MVDAACEKKIKAMPPPLNVPCPKICSKQNFIDGTHCSAMGLPPDTPFMTFDPEANGGKGAYCYCCCSCMTRDTPLEQSPGEYVLIQDVNAGDPLLVAGEDLKWKPGVVKQRTGDTEPATYEGMYLLVYKFEEEEAPRLIFVTPDHLFMRADDRKLKAVQHLVPGEPLMRNDGRAATVVFVSRGAYHTEIHTIEMEGNFDGKNLDGHLLNANGLVTTDYQVQAYYTTAQLPTKILFRPKGGAEALEVGEKSYEARFPSRERDAFINNPGAWPAGFLPLSQSLFILPADAKGFVVKEEAEQILFNGTFVPDSDLTSQSTIFKLFGYMRAAYPGTIYVLDWNNELPNAYSWTQSSQRFVVMTGGLARLVGLYTEGVSLILASVQSRLDGAPCVGDADYDAMAYRARKIWPDNMLPTIATAGIDQLTALFDHIKKQEPGNVCEAPTTKCRLEAFRNGRSFMGVPDCAKPVVRRFELVSAKGKVGVRQQDVAVTYNLPCEVVTATTTDNYAFAPTVEVVSAKMDPKTPDGTKVLLKVKGLKPKGSYTLTVKNVLSATGQPISPQHNRVKVEMGK